MSNNQHNCKILEDEIKEFWPQWKVVRQIGKGTFGSVFEICKDEFGVRFRSALKVIRISGDEATETVLLHSHLGKTDYRSSDTNDIFVHPQGALDESYSKKLKNYVTNSSKWTYNYSNYSLPEPLKNEISVLETLRGAPNVVNMEDVYFKQEGNTSTLFVRMELLTGLIDYTKNRFLNEHEIIKIGLDICNALNYCEKRKIIHRDIKPGNLFIDEFGTYKVGDFGASKKLESVHLAQTMTGIGTISYMAPEIYYQRHYNNTVDIYSLGLVLYQMLNYGRMPFMPLYPQEVTTADIDTSNFRRLHGDILPSIIASQKSRSMDYEVTKKLDKVIRKACSYVSEERYQTALEMKKALNECTPQRNTIEKRSKTGIKGYERSSINDEINNNKKFNNNDSFVEKTGAKFYSLNETRGKSSQNIVNNHTQAHQAKLDHQKVQNNHNIRAEHISKNWGKSSENRISGEEKTSKRNKKKTALFVLVLATISCALILPFFRPWEWETTQINEGNDSQDTYLSSPDKSIENVDKAACYRKGESLLEQSQYLSAAIEFGKANGFEDARKRSLELWQKYGNNTTLATNSFWILGIKENGNIVLSSGSGDNEDEYESAIKNLDEGKDAVSLAFYSDGSTASDFVKLRMDGTLTYSDFLGNPVDNDLSRFKDIIQIDGSIGYLAGLNSSGNVLLYDGEENKTLEIDNEDWHDITYMTFSNDLLTALRSDGSLLFCYLPFGEGWQGKRFGIWNGDYGKDIIKVSSAGYNNYLLILFSDGSVDAMYPRFECPELQIDEDTFCTNIHESDRQILHNMYDVKDLFADDGYCCFVYDDGSVSEMSFFSNHETYHPVYSLKNVQTISAICNYDFLVGLHEDGNAFIVKTEFDNYSDEIKFPLGRFNNIRPSNKLNEKYGAYTHSDDVGSVTIAETIDPYIRSTAKNISDSWEEIISASDDGTYIHKYAIGDKKEIHIGDEGNITMILVAKNRDELSDGSGKAHMTWIAQDLLKTEYMMEETEDTELGWEKSKIRSWLQDTILPSMPSDVQQAIKAVKKYSCHIINDEKETKSTDDKIWIPSSQEISPYYGEEEIGIDYREVFFDTTTLERLHIIPSSDASWWLRSADHNTNLGVVPDNEGIFSTIKNGVVIGFCL